jgi:hypothetical protein
MLHRIDPGYALLHIAITVSFPVTSALTKIDFMSVKTVGHLLSAGIFLLTLSTPLMAQNAPTSRQVLTPVGYRDAANVHFVPPGFNLTTMSDGHIRMENSVTGARVDFPNFQESVVPFTDSGTNFSMSQIAQLTWCTETLEVYGVSACSEFPNTAYSQMSGINVRTKAGTPSVNWGISNVATSCGVQTTVVTNGATNALVDIYY